MIPLSLPMSVRSPLSATTGTAGSGARDVRLDFFRGLALLFIFLNHIPGNFVNWLSHRNYGFSDATEVFVFISGYVAVVAYGSILARGGLALAIMKILHRCWQIYVAHIFLFVLFMAEIAYVATAVSNPLYIEEMQAVAFFDQPHSALGETLLLKFRPRNMDVLPLYIILLLVFPLVLLGLRACRSAVLGASFLLYVAARVWGWNLPAYPEGSQWFFNPFTWQFLFVLGAWFGSHHGRPLPSILRTDWLTTLAAAYVVFALLVVMTWHDPRLAMYMPIWLADILYPIDKTSLDPTRLFHFLALALITVRLVPDDAPFRRWWAARQVIACGQHSLQVFCAGTVLAFLGQFVLVEIDPSLAAQLVISIAGLVVMVGLAQGLTWYRRLEDAMRRSPQAARTAPMAATGTATGTEQERAGLTAGGTRAVAGRT